MFKRSVLLVVLVSVAALLCATPAWAQEAPLEASPAQVEFGAVDLHFGGNPQQNLKFTNATAGALFPASAELAGADASSFQIVNDGCTGNLLGGGENCSLEISFHASARRDYTATLVLDLFGESPLEVPISASAVTGSPSAQPSQLSFSPIPYNLPGSFEGESRESESLSIQNSSDAGTQIESISIVGPDAEDFTVEWGNCENNLLGPSNSCGMGIRFRPSLLGQETATLVVHDDSAAGPILVPLSGLGLRGPQITLDTTQALLGNVALGSSAQHAFIVTNSGDYPLYIQRAFLVTGTPLMFPVRTDSCSGQILQPSEACTMTLGFQPTTLGEKNAALLFITNTPAITVAGIDGVGVPSAEEASFSLSTPLLNMATPSTSAVPAVPTPTVTPDTAVLAPTPPPTLLAGHAPRLYRLFGRVTLDPGTDVQCPGTGQDCETLGFLVPAGALSGGTTSGFGRGATAVLGSSATRLHSGQAMHIRIPLTRRASARLKRRGHIRVRVGVVVQAGGAVVAQHSWAMRLAATGAVTPL